MGQINKIIIASENHLIDHVSVVVVVSHGVIKWVVHHFHRVIKIERDEIENIKMVIVVVAGILIGTGHTAFADF